MRRNQTEEDLALRRCGTLIILPIVLGLSAAADTVHHVRFSQTAKVLVWAEGDFIGQGPEVRITPQLDPVKPHFGSGRLEALNTMIDSAEGVLTLQIASNTGFVIEARTPKVANSISARVIQQGPNAQLHQNLVDPSSGLIFEQTTRTASRPGAATTQTLTLELTSDQGSLDEFVIRASKF